jgi:hypothetical protein
LQIKKFSKFGYFGFNIYFCGGFIQTIKIMKKIFAAILLAGVSIGAAAQNGLTVGAQGGYMTYYKDMTYGINLTYDVSTPFQLSLTGLMSPKISRPDEFNANKKNTNELFSLNLDARFLLINLESFATGPSVGAQWLHNKETITFPETYNNLGVNIGWHVQANLTDNIRLTGGWRYSTLKGSESYNLFYLGLGYCFYLN